MRVTAAVPGPELEPAGAGRGSRRGERRARFGGEEVAALVARGEPEPGERIDGPAIVELPEATIVVPPGWGGEVLAGGTLRMAR